MLAALHAELDAMGVDCRASAFTFRDLKK
jgi:hypothetical protein